MWLYDGVKGKLFFFSANSANDFFVNTHFIEKGKKEDVYDIINSYFPSYSRKLKFIMCEIDGIDSIMVYNEISAYPLNYVATKILNFNTLVNGVALFFKDDDECQRFFNTSIDNFSKLHIKTDKRLNIEVKKIAEKEHNKRMEIKTTDIEMPF